MSFLWDSVKQTAAQAGTAAKVAGHRTKLRADVLLLDRKITARKHQFGVELYDFVTPLSKRPEFFAADDRMIETLRGPFLATQREIASLENRCVELRAAIAKNETARAAAFPANKASTNPSTSTFGEKVVNAGKSASFAGTGAKLRTSLSSVETQIKALKQEFGLTMFAKFVELEDREQWLPTVRDIRSMYDQARQDVEGLQEKIAEKEKESRQLGKGPSSFEEKSSMTGSSLASGGPPTWVDPTTSTTSATSSTNNGFIPPAAAPSPARPSAPVADPFFAPTAGPANPAVNDPFASSAGPTMTDPFASTAPPATNTSTFAPAAPAPSPAVEDDPFAIFDMPSAQPAPSSTHQQQANKTSDNPMFRY